MNKITLAVVLFVLGALAFLGAWLIALNGDVLDSTNHGAWIAAGGFFVTCGFIAERVR